MSIELIKRIKVELKPVKKTYLDISHHNTWKHSSQQFIIKNDYYFFSLLIPIYLAWVVKFIADIENYMNAVERVLEYTDLDKESWPIRELYSFCWPIRGLYSNYWPIRGLYSNYWPIRGLYSSYWPIRRLYSNCWPMTGGGHAALPRQPRDHLQEGGDQPGQCVPGLPPGQQGHHRQTHCQVQQNCQEIAR